MTSKRIFLFLILGLFLSTSYAQEDVFGITRKAKGPKSESGFGNAARNILEAFSLEISGGGAYQQFSTDFYSANPSKYPFTSFRNFDNPTPDITQENALEMKSYESAFPLWNGGLRIDLFHILTIGGGFGQEWGKLSPMQGGDYEFAFEGASYQINKYYGTVGLVLYDANRRRSFLNWKYRNYSSSNIYMQSELRQRARQNYPWRFILEGEFGKMKLKKSYDANLVGAPYQPRLALLDEPYYGIGLRVERDFSEYTKAFLKAGGEFRKFTYAASDFSESQNLKQKVYSLQAGVAVRFPGTKRCKIAGCGVVMKHMHNGIEYRGSGIFNFQNRKIGQWY